MRPKIPLALALAFATVACARESQLVGQAFIVTQGRKNVKLGLVQVSAIPEADMTAYLDGKVQQILAEYDAAKKKSDECFDTLKQANALSSGPEWDKLAAKLASECVGPAETKIEDSPVGKLLAREAKIRAGRPFLESLPSEHAVATKTDADGRFTLKLRRGAKYAVAAQAERKVPGQDEPEEYNWLLWVVVDGERGEIFLSNDNMMSNNPADAVVQVPKAPDA
jgi:hypothetical protein